MVSKVSLTVGLLCLLCSAILVNHKPQQQEKEIMLYQMEIIDEHEVCLTSDTDTLTLLFENAYALAEQNNQVFVMQ